MDQQNNTSEVSKNVYHQIKQVLLEARTTVLTTVNTAMVQAYWQVGRLIVEAQGGEERAAYGDDLIKRISKRLTQEFGKGFSARNIRNMRQFYISYPIWQTVSAKLSWSHYLHLVKISNPKAREYYTEEAVAEKLN